MKVVYYDVLENLIKDIKKRITNRAYSRSSRRYLCQSGGHKPLFIGIRGRFYTDSSRYAQSASEVAYRIDSRTCQTLALCS